MKMKASRGRAALDQGQMQRTFSPVGVVRTSKHNASKPGHVHPPRGRAAVLVPEGSRGVPPHTKVRSPLRPATPMSWTARMGHYLGGREDGTMADLTGPQRRRVRKKINRQLRKRTAEGPVRKRRRRLAAR